MNNFTLMFGEQTDKRNVTKKRDRTLPKYISRQADTLRYVARVDGIYVTSDMTLEGIQDKLEDYLISKGINN
jgi:hypothetical protein